MSTVTTDGRDIDTQYAELTGEGSLQQVKPYDERIRRISTEWHRLPVPSAEDPTYYDRPVLKEPVWHWSIPLYYYVGGAAGASLVMGAAAQLDRSHRLSRFMRQCHWAGIAGSALSAGLLVYDLGRPDRFYNMLRVFRPTSPMNMGVWILSSISPSAIAAALFAHRSGILGAFGEISGAASGVSGLALSTYTGVLLANTAVPLWQEAGPLLPVLFGASAMASAGSIFDLIFEDRAARRITYSFGLMGRAVELATTVALERRTARVPQVAKPLRSGSSGFLWKTATVLTAGSLLLSVLPGKSPRRRRAAGILGTAGSLLMRYGIHLAGAASARDPRATFHHQRANPQ
jgi:formate-dependent nitrite reductase membrane component NrfD